MNIRNKLGRAAGVTAAAVVIGGVGLSGVASAAPVGNLINGPVHGCVFQTVNGHYLTAVGGGGRTTDVIHTDATRIGSWEKFTLIDSGSGTPVIQYGLQTTNGHYLTAVGRRAHYGRDPFRCNAAAGLGEAHPELPRVRRL